MLSQPSKTRAGNSADVLRILVAIGVLALLASLDSTEKAAAAPASAVSESASR